MPALPGLIPSVKSSSDHIHFGMVDEDDDDGDDDTGMVPMISLSIALRVSMTS